jgi:hypothetical protein
MSKEQAAASSEAGVLIGEAQAEYELDIGDIQIDPREKVLAMVRYVAKLRFASLGREREAAQFLRQRKPRLADLIKRHEHAALDQAIDEILRHIDRLNVPEPRPNLLTNLLRNPTFFGQLRQMSWTNEEIEALKWFRTADEDEASEASVSSIKIGDRLVTRAQIRERLRGYISNARLHECEQREKEAVELERENSYRRERNESTVHRQWS